MTNEEFQELLDRRLQLVRGKLKQRGEQYSGDNDRLHNFKKAGIRRGCSPERALLGMVVKHEVARDDMVHSLDNGSLPSKDRLDEYITDIINYMILLEALIVARAPNMGEMQ